MTKPELLPISPADRYISFDLKRANWGIRKEGHRRATAEAETLVAALDAARTLVAEDGGGRVVVLDRAGKMARAEAVAAK